MRPTHAELVHEFQRLRKVAFARLAGPLQNAVEADYVSGTQHAKTAADLMAANRAFYLHKMVP